MIKAHSRGHTIIFINNEWVYEDTNELLSDIRPCKRCGKSPTFEGYDACIGYVANVVSACCGHGEEVGYVIYEAQQ